jgi:hypothetical protein
MEMNPKQAFRSLEGHAPSWPGQNEAKRKDHGGIVFAGQRYSLALQMTVADETPERPNDRRISFSLDRSRRKSG